MKKYVLASEEARKTVDLRNYEEMITDVIFDVIDEDDLVVITRKDCYILDRDQQTTEDEETSIEKTLLNSELSQYCTEDGTLFTFIVDDEPYPYAAKSAKLNND